jgi:predicted RNA-binding protein
MNDTLLIRVNNDKVKLSDFTNHMSQRAKLN